MRELNQQEIEQVSGAGFIADAAATVGYSFGSIFDMGLKLVGVDVGKQSSEAAQTIGRGIGMVIETSVNVFSTVFSNMFKRS